MRRPPYPPPAPAQVACSYSHTVVVTDDDRTWTFGGNEYGQLGHGDHISRSAPAALACFQGLGVLSIACGVHHTVRRRGTTFWMQRERRKESEGGGARTDMGTDKDGKTTAFVCVCL